MTYGQGYDDGIQYAKTSWDLARCENQALTLLAAAREALSILQTKHNHREHCGCTTCSRLWNNIGWAEGIRREVIETLNRVYS